MNETVREDPDLTAAEKETMIRWAGDVERVTIHTEKATVIKWLLQHPEYQEDNRRVSDGAVRATTGTLPKGVVKLSGSSRQSSHTNQMLGRLPSED